MLKAALLLVVAVLTGAPSALADADPLAPLFQTTDGEPALPDKQPEHRKPAEKPDQTSSGKVEPVEVDKAAGRIAVAGEFIGTVGVIELGACSADGRTYLSAMKLKARPSRIAAAMKALGIEPGSVPVADPESGTATAPTGRKVNLYVEWYVMVKDESLLRRARLEELFWNRTKDEVLAESPWVYAGSKFVGDEESGSQVFTGDLSGSVATISRLDTSALFYYGGELPRTQVWHANPALKPAAGTQCRLLIEPVPEKKDETPGTESANGSSTDSQPDQPPVEDPKKTDDPAEPQKQPGETVPAAEGGAASAVTSPEQTPLEPSDDPFPKDSQ